MTKDERRAAAAKWQAAGAAARKERWDQLSPDEHEAEVAAIASRRWPGRAGDGGTGQSGARARG
jgi:hypothetical protein